MTEKSEFYPEQASDPRRMQIIATTIVVLAFLAVFTVLAITLIEAVPFHHLFDNCDAAASLLPLSIM